MAVRISGVPVGDHRNLVDLLNELRALDGRSLRKVAETAPFSLGHLSATLAGKAIPSPETAESIARELGASGEQQRAARRYAEGAAADRPARRAAEGGTTLPMRSAYMELVKERVGGELLGRAAELADLEAFCRHDAGPGYTWWRAAAWAGKSALMAWFVLHPPADVRVISFFVTARRPGHHDRAGFVDVLLEQLGGLLGIPPPALLTVATREAHLLDLLTEAAAQCNRQGLRLVLVVDGLDEDRGVTADAASHSIAALLPERLPHGMKVVVTGRPNPPLPFDVSDTHPLRSPSVVRNLERSPHAAAVRGEMERELRHLLRGTPQEQGLLGILVAAGGGLTGNDLAALTELDPIEIEDLLRAVTGRTFASGAARWRPEESVYTLGHEKLQEQAVRALGPTRLQGFRNTLHRWADSYQQAHWPRDAPEFLLRRYVQFLIDIGDTDRMVAYAADRERHDRMLDVSGSDSAALADVEAARAVLLAADQPDLVAMSRLAVHRERLLYRNARIPDEFPAVWEALGNRSRAEMLARTMMHGEAATGDPLILLAEEVARSGDFTAARLLAEDAAVRFHQRRTALHGLIAIAAEAGRLDVRDELTDAAHAAVNAVTTDDELHDNLLSALAGVVAVAGDVVRAVEILSEMRTLGREYGEALTRIAVAAARSERSDVVHVLTRFWSPEVINDPPQWAFGQFVRLAAATGDVVSAETMLRAVTDPVERCRSLAALAAVTPASKAAGYARAAAVLVEHVPERARNGAQLSVVRAWIGAGEVQAAVDVTKQMDDDFVLNRALSLLVPILASTRGIDEATSLARISRRSHPLSESPWLALVQAAADVGDLDRAEVIAGGLESRSRALALTVVADRLVGVGNHDRATMVAIEVERLCRNEIGTEHPVEAMAGLALALLEQGCRDEATALALRIAKAIDRDTLYDPDLLCERLAMELANAQAIDEAETLALAVDPGGDSWIRQVVAARFVEAGLPDRAARLVDPAFIAAIQHADPTEDAEQPTQRFAALAYVDHEPALHAIFREAESDERVAICTALAERGRFEMATSWAMEIDDLDERSWALAAVVEPACSAGWVDVAERTALAIPQDYERAKGLATVAAYSPGHTERAAAAEEVARGVRFAEERSGALAAVAAAMLATGDLERALAVARSIDLPAERAKALLGIADNLERPVRRKMIAEALAFARWDAVLPWLLKDEPSALPAIVGEIG
ncbi:helix-turn-helix transcriptional regulator [Dactylosporangium sp. NBC_01737]|uniref:helix-turn-helix transcriptional regulator n=1 Tax=Dactylosporangium sp. NBC_01737 TaxID=2975959 RepID=UPI002E12DFF6|nr:helix-turn-helix transcriptional regulator [Dactylosporangium sp. NBC_01737]